MSPSGSSSASRAADQKATPAVEVVDVDDEVAQAAAVVVTVGVLAEMVSDDLGASSSVRAMEPSRTRGAVVAHPDPPTPGAVAVGLQGEVQGALRAHGSVGGVVPADQRLVVPQA